VPLGQRLVVEAISIDAFMPAGQIAIQATFLASTDGGVTFRFPLPSLPSDVAGRDHFGTVLSTKLNVGAGNGVILSVRRNASTGTAWSTSRSRATSWRTTTDAKRYLAAAD
jgi:hypothetical protein